MATELYLERGPEGPWMAHAPSLPGACWLDLDETACLKRAADEMGRHAARLGRAPPAGPYVVAGRVLNTTGVVGESGSPMARFSCDASPPGIAAVWPAVERLARLIVETARGVPAGLRATRPREGGRSLDEVFVHLGNCVWWYCSRIDEGLSEWPDAWLAPEDRFLAFLPLSRNFYGNYPEERKGLVHVPARYPTSDRAEDWNYGKSLRRQAEHLAEHLSYLELDLDGYLGARI